ncbi:MAG: DNA repair protein RecN [Bacteroidetes bacterium]|nr:DNA repair protein RecN [Bacteroidota bacterium]
MAAAKQFGGLLFYFSSVLHKLTIKNYAIIDRLEIELSRGMNIITGETGAGKSILLGALGLILGERADTKALYDTEEKCVVEADFDIKGYDLKAFFAENELDFEAHTIVRREINQAGKSRAFINDTPVTLSVLKQLGEQLVNLHNQHETLELTRSGFQLSVIDILAKNNTLLSDYRVKLGVYRKDIKRLNELTEQNRAVSAELDYYQFQLSELTDAKLVAEEQVQLETEQSTLSNVEEIKRVLQGVINLLDNSEAATLAQLAEVQGMLKGVKNYNTEIAALTDRLHSAYEELKDISGEFDNIQEGTALDPERLEEVNARLNTIYKLQKKHNVNTIEELLGIQADLDAKVQGVDNSSAEIEALKASIDAQLKALLKLAEQLHSAREKVLREFQNNVVVLLTKVGMPNATFRVDIKKLEPHLLNENGFTDIKFLFSANKGFAPSEIKDVASGGELSRLMLSIKSLLADAGALPTMIFDEIDSGISGEVSLKVGEIMKQLSRNHQLISITHLPQIARTADKHLYIYKETNGNRTNTRIKELKGEDRVIELAKMLSGDKLSDAALANAREMIAG